VKALNACVLVKVIPPWSEAVLKELKKIRGVKKAYFAYGRFDMVAFLEAKDYGELKAAVDRINVLPHLRSTETLVEA